MAKGGGGGGGQQKAPGLDFVAKSSMQSRADSSLCSEVASVAADGVGMIIGSIVSAILFSLTGRIIKRFNAPKKPVMSVPSGNTVVSNQDWPGDDKVGAWIDKSIASVGATTPKDHQMVREEFFSYNAYLMPFSKDVNRLIGEKLQRLSNGTNASNGDD